MGRQRSGRIYHNLVDFNQDTIEATKYALDRTLDILKEDLYDFIREDIYNAYSPKWYQRTNSLLNDTTIETYLYKNTSDAIGVGIKFNDEYYNEHSERKLFQHGNEIKFLPMKSFLAIMNDWALQSADNPYHFPFITRRSFWNDFVRHVNKNFDKIFTRQFNNRMGIKPSANAVKKVNNSSMNLSSSTSNIRSLDTGNIGERTNNTLNFKITVE